MSPLKILGSCCLNNIPEVCMRGGGGMAEIYIPAIELRIIRLDDDLGLELLISIAL